VRVLDLNFGTVSGVQKLLRGRVSLLQRRTGGPRADGAAISPQWPAHIKHYTQAGESKLALLRVISFIFKGRAT
jgi:hypothetical protein